MTLCVLMMQVITAISSESEGICLLSLYLCNFLNLCSCVAFENFNIVLCKLDTIKL